MHCGCQCNNKWNVNLRLMYWYHPVKWMRLSGHDTLKQNKYYFILSYDCAFRNEQVCLYQLINHSYLSQMMALLVNDKPIHIELNGCCL
jgi:hypothetical protein